MTKIQKTAGLFTVCLLLASSTVMAQIPTPAPRIMEAPPTVEVCLLQSEEAHPDALRQMRESAAERSSHEATAEFQVTFENRCGARNWPEAAQEAFMFATDIWATHVRSTIPIRVEAVWDNDLNGNSLASAGPTLLVQGDEGEILHGVPGTWYPIAQANAMSGVDHHPGSLSGIYDIRVRVSCSIPNWDYGTDESVSGFDLVTVVLHEIGHGLGFLGTMTSPEGSQTAEWGNLSGTGPNDRRYPLIYDRFPEVGDGTPVLNETRFPNNSFALYRAVTGQENKLFFEGSEALRMNNFARVPLYAPLDWQGGSSYSHLDTQTFGQGENALMRHSIASNSAIRSPGPVFCGMFSDMNWPLGPSCHGLLGRDAMLALGQETIRFDLTNVDNPVDAVLTLTNDATSSDMMNGTLSKEGDQFSLVSDNSFAIEPGESVDIVLRFDPFLAGEFDGTLTINHNATNRQSPVVVPLVGRALKEGVRARLVQNYPNPFRDRTTIEYELPEPSHVALELFDLLGRRIDILVDSEKPSGAYKMDFNSTGLGSGIYYYRIRIGDFTETKSLIVVR